MVTGTLGMTYMLDWYEDSLPVAAEVWSQCVYNCPSLTHANIPSIYVDFNF